MADDLYKDKENDFENNFNEHEDNINMLKSIISDPTCSIHILEDEVPLNVQNEYFLYTEKMDKDPSFREVEDDDLVFMKDLVADPEQDIEKRKFFLSVLALQNKVSLYRYLQSLKGDKRMEAVKDWLSMAVLNSQMEIEKELSDKKQIFISCALGGKNKKIRFYALMMARQDKPFEDYQKKVIENEVLEGLKKMNVDVEKFRILSQAVEMLLLVPLDQIDKSLFERLIDDCNVYGDFMDKHLIMTNVHSFTDEQIQEQLAKRSLA